MLGKAFERFVEKAPVAVMVRGVLERVLSPDALNAIYERAAVKQYTRELMFSSVVGLMNLVVCGFNRAFTPLTRTTRTR